MPKVMECQSSRSEITELKVLDDNLVAFSSKIHGINIFSSVDCSTKLKINRVHEQLNSSTAATTFSPNAQFLAFAVKRQIYIFHMASRTLIKTIHVDGENIEALSFDAESKYIIAGTASGRILQYRYDGSSLLARLCSFESQKTPKGGKSFISSLSFYKDRLACGSNEGEICIVDLHSRANKISITNSKVRITSLCFVDEKTLISANSDGKIYINYLDNRHEPKQIDSGFTTISSITLMSNPNYIMINGNTNYVSIYDIKRLKVAHNKYIEFKDKVDKVVLAPNNTLIVSLKNMHIYRAELPSIDELKSLIVHNSLDEAFNMCERDFMMKDTKEYKQLQDRYNKIYNEAVQALINQQRKLAIQQTEMFMNVPSKRDEIKLLFKAFEHYPKLQTLYLEKKYPVAYALCAQYPALQQTFQYKKMEEVWKDAFKNAQRHIILGNNDLAKTSLSEFATIVSKQPLIKLVLNHNKHFIAFLKAMEAKNFQKVSEIAKRYEDFTKIPTYKNIETEIQNTLLEIEKHIKKCDIATARNSISKFEGVPELVSEVTRLTQECDNIEKLQSAYKENNFALCYEILDAHHNLSFTETGILLENHWSKIVQKSEEFALKGNIKEIKATLGELIHVETRREKIGDLLRVSFHTRTKALMAKKSFKNAENIIYSYIDIFGLDNEISTIMKYYEAKSKLKLAITQNSRQERDGWINSVIMADSSRS